MILSRRHTWARIPQPTHDDPKNYFLACERCNRQVAREEYWHVRNDCEEHIRAEPSSRANVGYGGAKQKIGVR